MNLHEYQAKELLLRFKLPLLRGKSYIKVLDGIKKDLDNLSSPPWAVKSQIHAGGRGAGYFKNSFNDKDTSITLSEVSKLPLLLPASDRFRTLIDRAFITSRLKQKISQEIDNPSSLLDLVLQDEGFAILAYSIAHRYVAKGELMSLPIIHPVIKRTLSTALPLDRPHTRLFRSTEAEIIKLINDYKDIARWNILRKN